MLKTTLSVLAKPGYIRLNKSRLDMDSVGEVGGEVSGGVDGGIGGRVGGRVSSRGIKNLSNVEKSAKSKKLIFTKVKSFGADFLTSGIKKALIYLQKAFTKVVIFHHFDTKYYIYIKTNASKYTIGKVLIQMTSDQCFSNSMTYQDSDFSKSKISQWHLIAYFFLKDNPKQNLPQDLWLGTLSYHWIFSNLVPLFKGL